MNVEVYKTNVKDWKQARALVRSIHQAFPGYQANFDLEDCDQILRVANLKDKVFSSSLILFLHSLGCEAEVIEDEINEGRVKVFR